MPTMFTIGGNKILLSKESVEAAMRGVSPERVYKYRVEIHGETYPIKQVICVAAQLPPAAFISTDAFRILKTLGFHVTS